MEKTVTMKNITDEMIAEEFEHYVASMENEERHTEAACKEVEAFEQYCSELFPGDIAKQTEMYDKMMDCAVEFEESGFITGFKWALSMLKEQGVDFSTVTYKYHLRNKKCPLGR